MLAYLCPYQFVVIRGQVGLQKTLHNLLFPYICKSKNLAPQLPITRRTTRSLDSGGASPVEYNDHGGFYRAVCFQFLDCAINFCGRQIQTEIFQYLHCSWKVTGTSHNEPKHGLSVTEKSVYHIYIYCIYIYTIYIYIFIYIYIYIYILYI